MRLFTAIGIDPSIAEEMAKIQIGLRQARWLDMVNMHVTLKFLGDVDRGQLDDVDAALSDIQAPAFDLSFCGVSAFDKGGRVHTVWAGIEQTDGIQFLRTKVESALVRAGFPAERRQYKPHATLARMMPTPAAEIANYLEAFADFAAGPMEVDRFTLYQSHVTHKGVYYQPLRDYGLSAYA